jgi:hypothetical protein
MASDTGEYDALPPPARYQAGASTWEEEGVLRSGGPPLAPEAVEVGGHMLA